MWKAACNCIRIDPTKSEWADYAAIQALCGNLSGNKLTRNSTGNTRSQSSQLPEPLWTDPDLKSGMSVRKLISTLKKKGGGVRRGMNCQIFARDEKATTTTTTTTRVAHDAEDSRPKFHTQNGFIQRTEEIIIKTQEWGRRFKARR